MTAPRAGRRRIAGIGKPMYLRLLAGETIERTPDNRSALVDLAFFSQPSDMPAEVAGMAEAMLVDWHEHPADD